MYEFWNDFVEPKSREEAKLSYMNTDSFIEHIKIEYIYVDIANDVETRFNISDYEFDRPLPRGRKKSNWFDER